MTQDEITNAREIISAATPGPWLERLGYLVQAYYDLNDEDPFGPTIINDDEASLGDLKFIAAARIGWPQALDEREEWNRLFIAAVKENEKIRADYEEANENLHRARAAIDAKSEDIVIDIERLIEERDELRAENEILKRRLDHRALLHINANWIKAHKEEED